MQKKTLFLLIVILVIAAFFRMWKLNEIPPGLYPDVALNGTQAFEALKTGNFKLFYPENNGREGLIMWLIALSFWIFGVSIWSIKIVAAIFGTLTILGLFLLVKELFDNENLALLASFFLATSFSHTLFSRIGFRAILLPFFLVFSFYFLFKGFKRWKIRDFIIAGIFFGLGFYTYISFRFAVLILPSVLIPHWLIYKKPIVHIQEGQSKNFLLSAFYFLLTTFIVALPIGLYFLKHPLDLIGRATPISIFAAKNPLKELVKSLVIHLGMFNFYGDANWRHNFAKSPMFPPVLGILFIIGIVLSLREILKKYNYQNKNYKLLSIFYFLLSTFFVMLLPGILTREGIPHFLRTMGVIPVVYIFVALGFCSIYNWLNKNQKHRTLLLAAVFLFLIAIGITEFNKYFNLWAKNPEVPRAYEKGYLDMGNFLNSLPEETQKYVIVNDFSSPLYGISIPGQSLMFVELSNFGRLRSIYLKAEDLNQIKTPIVYTQEGPKVIIVPLYPSRLMRELSKTFPEGSVKEINGVKFYEID
jgi:4-amino-4-deoxy-L-arabinose transferase-like glycosyltransferase